MKCIALNKTEKKREYTQSEGLGELREENMFRSETTSREENRDVRRGEEKRGEEKREDERRGGGKRGEE